MGQFPIPPTYPIDVRADPESGIVVERVGTALKLRLKGGGGGGGGEAEALKPPTATKLGGVLATAAVTGKYVRGVDPVTGGLILDTPEGTGPLAPPSQANNGGSNATTLPMPRLAKNIPRDQPLSPFWWIDPVREYGIRNRTDTADCFAALQSGLDAGEDIDLGPGKFCITDGLVMKRQAQVFKGRHHFTYPGSRFGASLDVDSRTYNVAGGKSPISPTYECSVSDFAIDFYQPTITNVSQLVQYPWAIDLRNASRAKVSRIRINRAWDGINGVVRTGQDVGGANTITDMEIGAFRYPFYFDAAGGDFLEIGRIRCWVFGMSDRADLINAYYGGTNIGATNPTGVFGQQDGLAVETLTMWKTKLVYNNLGSILHGVIANLNMDGGGSSLDVRGGNLSVANAVSLSDSPTGSVIVSGSTARCQIANLRLDAVGDFGIRALLEQSAGRLQIGNLQTTTTGSTRHVLQTGGDLQICQWQPQGVQNVARSRAMLEKSGGRLSLGDFRPEDIGTGSGNVIISTIDDFDTIQGHLVGWGIALPTTQNRAISNVK